MDRKIVLRILLAQGLLFFTPNIFAQSPGGIARQSLWLRGDLFPDKMQTQTLNFNPAADLNNFSTGIPLPARMDNLGRATIFTVFQHPGSEKEKQVWKMTGPFGDLALSNNQIASKSGKLNMVFGADNPPGYTESIISTYVRRQRSPAASDNAVQPDAVIRFGEAGSGAASSGLIAEFIVYETVLKEKDVARVESYLALKYGITIERNYLNSQGETIWDRKEEKAFSNNIAGIARDDQSALLQKQSTSCNTPEHLVIGLGTIAPANDKNTARISDGDYLVWGDNAATYALRPEPTTRGGDIMISDKNWLMKTSGASAISLSTQLKIDTKDLLPAGFPPEGFCLAIDRTGTGNFSGKECVYFSPDSISSDGIASFSGIFWDTDRSGKDVFAFGVRPVSTQAILENPDAASLLSFQVYPNPVTNGRYKIAVTLDKPADINIELYDANLRLVDTKKMTGQANYLFTGNNQVAAGVYIVKLQTAGKEFTKILVSQ